MIFPGRRNGHIIIQQAEDAGLEVHDYDNVLPVALREQAIELLTLLQRLDLRLYRALIRQIVEAHVHDIGLRFIDEQGARLSDYGLPARWRYSEERRRREGE